MIFKGTLSRERGTFERIKGDEKMSIITIIGAGQMGSALTFPAVENGHEVRLVGTHIDREIIDGLRENQYHKTLKAKLYDTVKYYQIEEMEEAIEGSDAMIGGVSSFGVDWFGTQVLPKIPNHIPVITVTKGMINEADGSLTPYPDYWERMLPEGKDLSLNAIGGPCIALKLTKHDQTHVAFCGKDMEILRMFKKLLATDYYHISLSTDVTGVECAVALKNGYAMATATAIGMEELREDGMELFNAQALLFGQSMKEMARLLEHAGGEAKNLVHGIGDLYVTVHNGRSRKIGVLLGKGIPYEEAKEMLAGETLEAVVIAQRTAQAVRDMIKEGKAKAQDYLLLLHIDDVITKGEKINIPWEAFTEEA